jgi:hypothetical protein
MEGRFVEQVDHSDHDASNNKWNNLVEATYESNGKNHPKTIRNSTGIVGVSQRPDGKYIARVYVERKHKFIGVFPTLEQAAEARRLANIKHGFHPNHGV